MGFTTAFRARGVRIPVLVLLFSGLALLVIWQRPTHVPAPEWFRKPSPLTGPPQKDPRCSNFPDPGNIAIAVKTGATEAVEKIPMLMRTTLQCAQNVMIFSDLEQNIAGHHLHDALADIPPSAMEGNSDFEFYHKLKEAQKYGQIEKMLRGAHDPRITHDLASWTLDKYKQLHILEKLYATYPDKDWYMMVDADTYIVWPNLLTWIEQLPNPKTTKLYLGSPAEVGDVKFAHGGSGMLLSQAAMYEFAVTNKGVAASWDKPMHEECCGDLIIATALKKMGILLKPSWPTINGEKPITLPFGPTHWCQPLVTMHHAQPNEMNQIANFELSRNNTRDPLTLAELFNAFVRNILPDALDQWDNGCTDATIETDSYEACRDVCKKEQRCFQFSHHDKQCALGFSIHLGVSKEPGSTPSVRSGWLTDRIKSWADEQAPCTPKFPWTN